MDTDVCAIQYFCTCSLDAKNDFIYSTLHLQICFTSAQTSTESVSRSGYDHLSSFDFHDCQRHSRHWPESRYLCYSFSSFFFFSSICLFLSFPFLSEFPRRYIFSLSLSLSLSLRDVDVGRAELDDTAV